MTKEKPNEDIELARQSGYIEACYEFNNRVKKLKEEFPKEPFLHRKINEIMEDFSQDNHSPQDKTSAGVPVPEDTSKDICECGKEEKYHPIVNHATGQILCKKFKPKRRRLNIMKNTTKVIKGLRFKDAQKKKGCGKKIQFRNKKYNCGDIIDFNYRKKTLLCPKCQKEDKNV